MTCFQIINWFRCLPLVNNFSSFSQTWMRSIYWMRRVIHFFTSCYVWHRFSALMKILNFIESMIYEHINSTALGRVQGSWVIDIHLVFTFRSCLTNTGKWVEGIPLSGKFTSSNMIRRVFPKRLSMGKALVKWQCEFCKQSLVEVKHTLIEMKVINFSRGIFDNE